MRILLDESLPRELKHELPGYDVQTVQDAGWAGLNNGELLRRAAERFDLFLTADQNLQYQRNLSAFPADARQGSGFQLDRVQRGLEPDDWKPMATVG
jgi:hypothetical protein